MRGSGSSASRDADGSGLRILAVIPGEGAGVSMIFCRRQVDRLEKLGCVVHRFFLSSRTDPAVIWKEMCRLRRESRSFAPDVVHAHFGTMTGMVAALSTRGPLVVTFRGSDLNPIPSGKPWRTWLGHAFSRFAARRAVRIICVSEELRSRLPVDLSDRIAVIPTGVSTELFRPMPRAEARKRLGWDSAPVVLFNAGREPAVKRLDLAVQAYEEARRQVPDLVMEVMKGGTAPDDVPLLMNAADALLFTSDFEGSPNIVKEAIACGLPVVSVPVGDVPVRLQRVEPSRMVGRDPRALGDALAGVIRDGRRSNGSLVAAEELDENLLTLALLEQLKLAVRP